VPIAPQTEADPDAAAKTTARDSHANNDDSTFTDAASYRKRNLIDLFSKKWKLFKAQVAVLCIKNTLARTLI